MTNTNRNEVTERILDLTLEVNFLLTGEDCVVVTRSGESRSQSSGCHQSLGAERPPHSLILERSNEQKILELTNKIIHLLTGEVMGYIQGFKEVYKNVEMEPLQPLNSLDISVIRSDADGFHDPVASPNQEATINQSGNGAITNKPPERTSDLTSCERESHEENVILSVRTEPASTLVTEEPALREEDANVYPITEYTETEHPSACMKVDPAPCEEENFADTDLYSHIEYTLSSCKEGTLRNINISSKVTSNDANENPTSCDGDVIDASVYTHAHATGYPTAHIKEEPASCEGDVIELYNPREHLQAEYLFTPIKGEPTSCEERDVTGMDNCVAVGHTQTVYPTAHVKEESASYEEGNLLNPHPQVPVDPALTEYPYTHINKEPASCGEGNLPMPDIQIPYLSGMLNNATIISPDVSTISPDFGEGFSRKTDFTRHPYFHPVPHKSPQERKPLSCPECGKCFKLESALKLHQRIHSGEKPYGLSGQTADPHRPQGPHARKKAYSCSECGKCFGHVAHLRKHQVVHMGGKFFPCAECGKWFSCRSNLNTHLRIHTGEKPFSCSECGKCFADVANLAHHQLIHTGEKPFSCPICGKRFAHKTKLTSHQWIHTGEKAFSCSKCGRCFSRKFSLNRHQWVHTGEKAFPCPKCGRHFSSKFSLTRHQRVHVESEPFFSP